MIGHVRTLICFAVLLGGYAVLPAQEKGGKLCFPLDTLSCALNGQTPVRLQLRDYAGSRMTTCQFRVVSRGPFHILGIAAGTDLPAPGWTLRSSLHNSSAASAGAFTDTVLAVFYGPGLASGTYASVATLTIDVGKGSSLGGTLEVSQVLGADATGDDVGLRAGGVLTVQLREPRQGAR